LQAGETSVIPRDCDRIRPRLEGTSDFGLTTRRQLATCLTNKESDKL
jgi:hypothetical protein